MPAPHLLPFAAKAVSFALAALVVLVAAVPVLSAGARIFA